MQLRSMGRLLVLASSAIVRRVAEAGSKSREAVLRDIGEYVSTLLAALNG